MIKLSHTEVVGWEHAIRGMRNPLESWNKSDSEFHILESPDYEESIAVDYDGESTTYIGPNDQDLMKRLCKAGTDHRKFMRMLVVYVDILAPLYWWKEFDTYKVGTVVNSCSTMHCIHKKEFTLDDFSHEHLLGDSKDIFCSTISTMNFYRNEYLSTKNKKYWWQMIQLLPSSYNQRRTVMLNYEVLANIYKSRKDHKITDWVSFCSWIESLPYSKIIIGENYGTMD